MPATAEQIDRIAARLWRRGVKLTEAPTLASVLQAEVYARRKPAPGQAGLFDEKEHPREPAGGPDGGQFTAKEEAAKPAPAKPAAHDDPLPKPTEKIGRSRKTPVIVFKTPIKGPSGATLHSYEWKYRLFEDVDDRGEEVVRKISDWEQAVSSDDTGRDIVHHFSVTTPSGTTQLLSLESALTALGYAPKSTAPGVANIKTLASAVKRRALAQMKLDQTKDLYRRIDEAVDKGELPPGMLEEAGELIGKQWAYIVKPTNWKSHRGYMHELLGKDEQKIADLDKHIQTLAEEAADAENSGPDKYRAQLRRIHELVDTLKTDDHGTKWQSIGSALESRMKSRAIWGKAKTDIQGELRPLLVRLLHIGGFNALGERTGKTLLADEIPETTYFGKKVAPIPAANDRKVAKWYLDNKQDIASTIKDVEAWITKWLDSPQPDRYAHVYERYARNIRPAANQRGLFREEDHPRGQPENAGEFVAKGQGTAAGPEQAKQQQTQQAPPDPGSTSTSKRQTDLDIAKIIADTAKNDPNVNPDSPIAKGAEAFRLYWMDSDYFTLQEIPIASIEWRHPQGKAIADPRSNQPIILETNRRGVGYQDALGRAPHNIVLDGQNRLEQARSQGKQTILAWVGNKASVSQPEQQQKHPTQQAGELIKAAGKRLPPLDQMKAIVGEAVSKDDAERIFIHAGLGELTAAYLADELDRKHPGKPISIGGIVVTARHQLQEEDREGRLKEAMAAAGNARAVQLEKEGSDVKFMVFPSTYPDQKGKWQLSRFDSLGPSGHQNFPTREEAIASAIGAHKDPYWDEGDSDFRITRVMGTMGSDRYFLRAMMQAEHYRRNGYPERYASSFAKPAATSKPAAPSKPLAPTKPAEHAKPASAPKPPAPVDPGTYDFKPDPPATPAAAPAAAPQPTTPNDPDFERLHPRGKGEQGGQFVAKPGADKPPAQSAPAKPQQSTLPLSPTPTDTGTFSHNGKQFQAEKHPDGWRYRSGTGAWFQAGPESTKIIEQGILASKTKPLPEPAFEGSRRDLRTAHGVAKRELASQEKAFEKAWQTRWGIQEIAKVLRSAGRDEDANLWESAADEWSQYIKTRLYPVLAQSRAHHEALAERLRAEPPKAAKAPRKAAERQPKPQAKPQALLDAAQPGGESRYPEWESHQQWEQAQRAKRAAGRDAEVAKIDAAKEAAGQRYRQGEAMLRGVPASRKQRTTEELQNRWKTGKRLMREARYQIDRHDQRLHELTAIPNAAAKYGIDEKKLEDAATWLLGEKGVQEAADRLATFQEVRRSTGLTRDAIDAWEDEGGDSSTWPGLANTARSVAGEHPELGIGTGYTGGSGYDDTDYAERLWELMKGEDPHVPSIYDDEVLSEAADFILAGEKQGQLEEEMPSEWDEWSGEPQPARQEEDEPVPFAKQGARERYGRFLKWRSQLVSDRTPARRKHSSADANYRSGFAGVRCADCRWQQGQQCQLVEGGGQDDSICDLWTNRPGD